MEEYLRYVKRGGIETLVSMLEGSETISLGLEDEGPAAVHLGLKLISYPIPDTRIPFDVASFRVFAARLADRLRAGEHIGVHCRGSIGRSTVTVACALIHLGWKPKAALAAIAAARGLAVPDTQEQQDWIMRYKTQA
jgi:protein-tyrosine phosphatase